MKFPCDRFGVELHLHLDGAFRAETIYKYAVAKGIKLPSTCPTAFKDYLVIRTPNSLLDFLGSFDFILPAVAGDPEALTELTVQCLEDCATKGGLCYVELRFSPHLLSGPTLSPEMVVKTIIAAVDCGSKKYNINVRLILCMMRHMPEHSAEVTRLAKCYQNHGVVAVDVAGDDKPCDGTNTAPEIKQAFNEAKNGGLHRCAHAGENGCAASVTEAVNDMFAERIGHGYHILDEDEVYDDMKQRNMHFELCPLSSKLTGSVVAEWEKHPIHRFIADNVNFSINTDDPTVTGQWKVDEEKMLKTFACLTSDQLEAANLRAASAAFLPEGEKEELMNHVRSQSLACRTDRH